MTKPTQRALSAVSKAKIALAAMKGDKTLAELTQQFKIHPIQVTHWKKQLQEQCRRVRERPRNGDCATSQCKRIAHESRPFGAREQFI